MTKSQAKSLPKLVLSSSRDIPFSQLVLTSLGRAQTLDAANSAAAKAQAREQLRRFLTPGRGYVATSVQMFRY